MANPQEGSNLRKAADRQAANRQAANRQAAGSVRIVGIPASLRTRSYTRLAVQIALQGGCAGGRSNPADRPAADW